MKVIKKKEEKNKMEKNDIIFKDEKEIDAKDLLVDYNKEFDFNKILNPNFKATKPKPMTKKQKRTKTKIVKSSRRKNRH